MLQANVDRHNYVIYINTALFKFNAVIYKISADIYKRSYANHNTGYDIFTCI